MLRMRRQRSIYKRMGHAHSNIIEFDEPRTFEEVIWMTKYFYE